MSVPNDMAKALDTAGVYLDVMIGKMVELRALPIALVVANADGRLFAIFPQMPAEAIPTLGEWIRVWPGMGRSDG
jgi:hypothetical protein